MAMWIGGGMRLAILGMSIFGWLLSGQTLLFALLAMLLAFGLFSGGQRVIFQAIFAKVIPIHRRGRLQAVRNMVGGLVAAVLAYLAGRYLIEGQVWGNGYSTTFLLAFVLTSMGLVGMRLLLREPDPPTLREQVGLWERLKDCPALLREDPQFGFFLAAQALAVASVMAAPFYTLYAGTKIELTGATLGALSLAYLGADTVMNMVWGNLADRFGYRFPFICALILWAASLALLIVSPSLPMFCAAFFGLGAAQAGYAMCSQTMILEYGTRDDIALRLAISATLEGSLAATMPLIGGLVATLAGYPVVFLAAMACQGAALLLLITRVKDPRHRIA
jgi:MFS family permease